MRQAPAPYTGHSGSTHSPFRSDRPPTTAAKAASSRKPAKLYAAKLQNQIKKPPPFLPVRV